MKRLLQSLIGAFLLLQATEASASRQCALWQDIVAAANFLISEPDNPRRFWRDRYGDNAAYLKLKYDYDMADPAKRRALFDMLEKRQRPPYRLLELKLAQATSAERAAVISETTIDPAAGSVIPKLLVSAQRALIVQDGGERFFTELARWRAANPDAFERNRGIEDYRLAEALSDLDNDRKLTIARQAEQAGARRFAALLLQQRPDLGEFSALLDRWPNLDSKERERFVSGAVVWWGREELLDEARQPDEIRRAIRSRPYLAALQPLKTLMHTIPDSEMLATALNQIGDMRIASEIAPKIIADVKAGRIDTNKEPDRLFAVITEELDRLIGRGARESQFRALKPVGAWAMGETAAEAVDKALARLALAPFVRGEASEMPARPAAMSAQLAWDDWVAAAKTIRGGRLPDPAGGTIAVELLVASGRTSDAIYMLRNAPDWEAARLRAYALMVALDQRCPNPFLVSLSPLAEPIYIFDR